MLPIERMIRSILKGRQLVAVGLYLLPFLVLVGLGFLWLAERGWALQFVLLLGLPVLLYRLGLWLLTRRARRRAGPDETAPEEVRPLVEGNPDWTAREAEVFAALSAEIRATLPEPIAWPALQDQALAVMKSAARQLSDGRKDVWDFSLPEALLLAGRVSTQLRADLRRYVPLSDTVSLSTLFWLWRHREWIGHANTARRLFSSYVNLPRAAAQEAVNLLLGEAMGGVRSSAERTVQRLVLEETAKAAIDLFGGHLRFSDAELLDITLASQLTDLAHQAQEDLPLRLVVVGQISAGKTSLVNALLQETRAETDMAPTTPGVVSHRVELASSPFTLVDTEGIDGSGAVNARLLAELLQADLVLWVVRANRPARAPDLVLMQALRAALAAQPLRRAPRILVAVTAIDTLMPVWPLPENWMAEADQARLAEVLAQIGAELDAPLILPVVASDPDWNIDRLEALLGAEVAEALMVQRNRRRLAAEAARGTVLTELGKGGRGVLQAGRLLWKNRRK